MIYDAFCFNSEFDLLRIRCEELKQLDVVHVLVESSYTFSGKPKPLHFQENKEKFKQYPIIHIVMTDPPDVNPWVNEQCQRDACMGALQGCKGNDVIIIADADECPRASSVAQYKPLVGPVALQMDLYYYYLNVLSAKGQWNIAKIMPRWVLNDHTPNEVRNMGVSMAMLNAGWHFTYAGGVASMLEKFRSFSHQEPEVQRLADEAILTQKLSRLESLWGTDTFTQVPVSELPAYVQANKDEFKSMIYGI